MGFEYIRFFGELGIDDVPSVGGKNASLGELYRELTSAGVLVPNGFALTAQAYRHTLEAAGAWPKLQDLMSGLNPADVTDLAHRAAAAREMIRLCPLPSAVVSELARAVARLQKEYGEEMTFAVRSSATAEDLPSASFAGQHESYLNVHQGPGLVAAVSNCFASLFTDRAIRYRIDNGFEHLKVFNSVGIMKMVRSDQASSGVIFTLDTETGFENVVFITGAFGLGETIVQGSVDPDEFYVFKPTFRAGKRCVLKRSLGSKETKLIYSADRTRTTELVSVPENLRAQFCIPDEDVLTLAGQAIAIEDHYSARAATWRPMDIEWAKDAVDGRLYIIQARPETVASRRNRSILITHKLQDPPPPKLTGRAVGTLVASGTARVVTGPEDLSTFRPGEILVAETTSPDWGTVIKAAAAIVTNRGGRTCHAAIVARESGIPAIVGTGTATEVIKTGDVLTVSCAEGDIGHVYDGAIAFETEETNLEDLPRPSTRIMMNIGNPEDAFSISALPNDGVGLARMEFIISEFIKIHPMALVHPERVSDRGDQAKMHALTAGHSDLPGFFTTRLSEGIGTIAAAFHPKPVILRLSDFKTNEYASLIGGSVFEPQEANPMIGFRGASRYAHPAYAEGFALECAAIKRVRSDMGLDNVRVMVPFCRTLDEADRVLRAMASHGLQRGKDGLEVYLMCEIPNNVVLIDDFSQRFDGFSIGSNDLTQLTLGVDRDSEIVAFDFDERDKGVMQMIRLAVEGAKRNRRHSGICGQAPSDFPDFAEYLVSLGIDSISLNPDSVLSVTRRLATLEQTTKTEERSSPRPRRAL